MYIEELQAAISIYFEHRGSSSNKEEASALYDKFLSDKASVVQVLILGKLGEVIKSPGVQKELQRTTPNMVDLFAAILLVYTTEYWESTYVSLVIYEILGVDCKAPESCKTLEDPNVYQLLRETNETIQATRALVTEALNLQKNN
jgi:hypothetical protein